MFGIIFFLSGYDFFHINDYILHAFKRIFSFLYAQSLTGIQSSSSSSEDEESLSMTKREGFICAVCLDVYFSPYICHPCNHIFCEPCLRTLAKNSPTNTPCPLCRTVITHVFFQKGETKTFQYNDQTATYLKMFSFKQKVAFVGYYRTPCLFLELSCRCASGKQAGPFAQLPPDESQRPKRRIQAQSEPFPFISL